MKRELFTVAIVCLLALIVRGQSEVVSFDGDWKFARFGEQVNGAVIAEPEAQKETFDDAAWRTVQLPHDWGVESPFCMDISGTQGRLPYFGIGWYRKVFTLPEEDRGRCVFLDIDGAMSDSLKTGTHATSRI